MAVSLTSNFNLGTAKPLDYRTVYQSDGGSQIYPKTISASSYPGMHVFDVTTQKEFICFTRTELDAHDEEITVKEWHELNTEKTYTISLGGSDTLESGLTALNGKISDTTPLAVIGSIVDQEKTVYKYVFNGEEFVPFSSIGNIGTGEGGSGGGSGTDEPEQTIINNITNNYISTVILNFNTEDGFADINAITSEALTQKYLTATEKQSVEPGTVVDVVYTKDDYEYFRTYVYVNDVWNIKCGTQNVDVLLPGFQNWEDWTVPSEYQKENNNIVWVEKTQVDGKVIAYVKNMFGVQFVTTQVFKKQPNDDLNNDNLEDYYSLQLLASIGCVNMSNANTGGRDFYVCVELAVSNSETEIDNYTILLQK